MRVRMAQWVTCLVLTLICQAEPVITVGRDASQQTQSNTTTQTTARIRGRVLAADTGQPVRRAAVRAISAAGKTVATVLTDKGGRFELRDLPIDQYTLRAIKAPFLTTLFGQRNPGDQPEPIDLTTGNADKVEILLRRGGAVAGFVTDETGEPVVGARVRSLRFRHVRGRRELTPGSVVATTDDLGQFRLYGLAPGEYAVSASARLAFEESGRDDSGYALTYYPGTASVSEIQPITVSAGQTVSQVTLSLVPSVLARVGGVLLDTSGAAVSFGVVSLVDRTINSTVSVGQTKADGSFVISSVPPGEYFLKSDSTSVGPDHFSQIARLPIAVRGEDVLGLTLSALPSVTVSGRIAVDAETRSSPPDLTGVEIEVHRMFDDGLSELRQRVAARRDLTFQLPILAGRVLVRLYGLPNKWAVSAVRLMDVDVVDTGLDLSSGRAAREIVIEIADTLPVVSGNVVTASGETLKDYSVIVFSKDSSRWGWNSRYVRHALPRSSDAGFDVGPVPSGDYYAIAVPPVNDDRWADVEYLERLSRYATVVTLSDRERSPLRLVMTMDK